MENRNKVKRQDPPDIVRSGSQIVLPENPRVSIDDAITWLQRKKTEEETIVALSEQVNAYPWDGAIAFMQAIREMFGFASAEAQRSFFGTNPPRQLSVAVGPGKYESVAWGAFKVPGLGGTLYTSSTTDSNGRLIFQLMAEVPKKYSGLIRELAERIRAIVAESSIYRGKALRFSVDSDGDAKVPEFIDLSRVQPEELIFSSDVAEQIDTTVFAPLRRREFCKALGIPFKRGVCLMGVYGTGKTLAMYVAARHASLSGVTFILCEDAEQLPQAMHFARQYSPAVVAVEDIDRVTRERDNTCNEIMDALDGLEAKDADVMVLFTSNHGEEIHEAMRRPGRIDTFIRIAPPDADAVRRLLMLYGRGLIGTSEDLTEPAGLLAGQIPAVIREVVERAKLAAVARAETLDDARSLTSHDLSVAARRMLMQAALFAPKSDESDASLRSAVAVLGSHMLTPAAAVASRRLSSMNGHAARP